MIKNNMMNKRVFNQQNLTRRLRLLSVLYAMLLMPLSGWAQGLTFGGDGSSTNPFVISTASELKDFADQYNAGALTSNCSVELSTNIDCTNLTGFSPIGNSTHPFTGTFDGKHYTISNLTCSAGGYFGLFGEVGSNGTPTVAGNVSYLTLDNCTFSGESVGGAIAGYLCNGTITNCTVSSCTITASSTSGNAAQAGAIIGHCNNNNITLTNNFYEYTVKTITQNNNVTDERTGYVQRGVGDFVYDPDTDTNVYTDITAGNGAVMYTKTLTAGGSSECWPDCYEPLTDFLKGIYALAPGQTVDIYLYPDDDIIISAASLVYTPSGGEEQTENLTNIADPGEYRYSLEMPDADATLNTTIIQAYNLWIGDTRVTSANAADVLGDGKVSYANGMLTLNGATLASGITSSLDQLKIVLAGENSIAGTMTGTTGTLYFATNAANAKLTFTTTEENAVSGFSEVKYLNGLRMKSVAGGFDVSIPSDYNLMVGGKAVTSDNREDVFGDGGSVIYDGENTLILTNAELTQKIELSSDNTLDNLYIHLAGQNNTITSADNVIVSTAKPNMELHFVTIGGSPGKLVYTSENTTTDPTLGGAFTGFSKVSFDNDLEATLSGKTMTIAQKMEPIINDDTTSGRDENANVNLTNGGTEMQEYNNPGTKLSNTIISDILFTLDDDGTKNSPDGYDGEKVVINSEVSDADLAAAMNLEPGSDAFNEKFTGLTFKIPASTGTISIEAWSDCGHQLCIKIGDQTPVYITLTDTPTTYDIDYTCGSDTYVYIYLPQSTPSSAPRHVRGRIGPKSSVSGGLGSLSVSSSSMVSAASCQPASNYMLLDKMAADAVIASVIPGEGLSFNDVSITDLEDNMFLAGGGAPTLKISSDLPFIDMSGTSIRNMKVSRSAGPFNGVPENVFIYMPAGNTTSEKNVVIGDVCDRMELKAELPGSGENEAKPFKVSKNFTAAQATLMRTFAEGGDESKATIYLPYAIPQETADQLGQFFKFDGISGDEVQMTKVTSGGLKANKPYIFQAKAGGVVNPEVKIVTVQGMPGETEGFKGVYEQTTCGGDNWYGYAAEEVDGATIGQFVKLGSGASIAPFRAYMVANGNKPSYAIRWGGVDEETTAIEEPEIQTVNERKPVEGWYTLTGARLLSQPTKPGLYIYNGRTVVVK